MFLLPDQSPLAVHSDASVEVQLMVVDSPLVMLSGLADRETVGTGAGAETVTLTEPFTEPPAPLQFRLNVLSAVSEVKV